MCCGMPRPHRSVSTGGGKLPAAQGGVNLRSLTLCALTAVAMSGCFRFARTIPELPDGDWTERLGDPAHAAFITERVPATVRIDWDVDVGRGIAVAAIVRDNLIVSAVSGGGVLTANAESGRQFWTRRFNGPLAGQVLRVGPRIYFATQHRNGTLYALDLHRGRRRWSRRLGSPAAAEPAYADGRLYLGTNRDVQAFDADDGRQLWRIRLGGPPVQPPVVMGDELLVAVRDTLFRIAREDGSVSARIGLAGEPSAPIAVRGDTLVIAMQPGIVAAFVDGGERELWRHAFSAPVIAAPVVTDEGVFILTRSAELHLVHPHTTRRIIVLDGAATESLTVTAEGCLIGTLDGRLVFVSRDGTRVWEQQLDGSIRAPAVVHDADVYVGTLTGRLVKLTAG